MHQTKRIHHLAWATRTVRSDNVYASAWDIGVNIRFRYEDKDEELATFGIRAAGLKIDDDFKDLGRRSGVRLTNI